MTADFAFYVRPIVANTHQMAANGERHGTSLFARRVHTRPMITWNFRDKSCPCCGSQEVTRSRRQGFFERGVLGMTNIRPYRCMDCDARYYGRRHYENAAASLHLSTAQRH